MALCSSTFGKPWTTTATTHFSPSSREMVQCNPCLKLKGNKQTAFLETNELLFSFHLKWGNVSSKMFPSISEWGSWISDVLVSQLWMMNINGPSSSLAYSSNCNEMTPRMCVAQHSQAPYVLLNTDKLIETNLSRSAMMESKKASQSKRGPHIYCQCY